MNAPSAEASGMLGYGTFTMGATTLTLTQSEIFILALAAVAAVFFWRR